MKLQNGNMKNEIETLIKKGEIVKHLSSCNRDLSKTNLNDQGGKARSRAKAKQKRKEKETK